MGLFQKAQETGIHGEDLAASRFFFLRYSTVSSDPLSWLQAYAQRCRIPRRQSLAEYAPVGNRDD
jgi:hypothetical protein